MKTTIDLPEPLFKEAKRVAARNGRPFRMFVITAIQERLKKLAESKKKAFSLRDESFEGQGLNDEFAGKSWDEIREEINLSKPPNLN